MFIKTLVDSPPVMYMFFLCTEMF